MGCKATYLRLVATDRPQKEQPRRVRFTSNVHNGHAYAEIRRGLYGLPHAGRIANDNLVPHFANHGYIQAEHTPGLFNHVGYPFDTFVVSLEGDLETDMVEKAWSVLGLDVTMLRKLGSKLVICAVDLCAILQWQLAIESTVVFGVHYLTRDHDWNGPQNGSALGVSHMSTLSTL